MGVSMQIAYFGFAGSPSLEAEAAAQLVRIERFSPLVSDCHLAIEAMRGALGIAMYGARLDLVIGASELRPLPHCTSSTPEDAVRDAFDRAERELLDMYRRAADTHH
jgi:hypothetical protein